MNQEESKQSSELQPFYEDVRSHYDLSDGFFALFLDPTMTYSCAYFERDDMTLEEAQIAKIDLALGKCAIPSIHDSRRPRLLDIGCGWGTTARRAAEKHGADVIGLTLSQNQAEAARERVQDLPSGAGTVEIRVAGWEQFDEPVDRIVSIGAFEHFRMERYDEFFCRCRKLLPEDGRMLLHTITCLNEKMLAERGLEFGHEHVLFAKFIPEKIFQGGQLCQEDVVAAHAEQAGFKVERIQSLQKHYARTLAIWASNLEAAKDEAIRTTSEEVYSTYMKYLTGCSKYFGTGHIDVCQFTLVR